MSVMTLTYDDPFGDPATPRLKIADYATLKGVAHRTVTRALKRPGGIPGAEQDDKGRWWIPIAFDIKAKDDDDTPDGTVTMLGSAPVLPVVRPAKPAPVPVVSRVDALDRLPAMLTIEQAAAFLGISEYQVRQQVEKLEGERWGDNGAWLIPQAAIRSRMGI